MGDSHSGDESSPPMREDSDLIYIVMKTRIKCEEKKRMRSATNLEIAGL